MAIEIVIRFLVNGGGFEIIFRSVKKISTDEVLKRMKQNEKLQLIDVRTKDEVDNGKIPGVRHIPLHELPARMHEIDKDKECILVCRSGNRSGKAAKLLKANGFNAINMTGGMLGWKGKTE